MESYRTIIEPNTNIAYNIESNEGKSVLGKFLNQMGGNIEAGVIVVYNKKEFKITIDLENDDVLNQLMSAVHNETKIPVKEQKLTVWTKTVTTEKLSNDDKKAELTTYFIQKVSEYLRKNKKIEVRLFHLETLEEDKPVHDDTVPRVEVSSFKDYIITSQFIHLNKGGRSYSGIAGFLCIKEKDYTVDNRVPVKEGVIKDTVQEDKTGLVETAEIEGLKYTLFAYGGTNAGLPGFIGLPFPGISGDAIDMAVMIERHNAFKAAKMPGKQLDNIYVLGITQMLELMDNSLVFYDTIAGASIDENKYFQFLENNIYGKLPDSSFVPLHAINIKIKSQYIDPSKEKNDDTKSSVQTPIQNKIKKPISMVPSPSLKPMIMGRGGGPNGELQPGDIVQANGNLLGVNGRQGDSWATKIKGIVREKFIDGIYSVKWYKGGENMPRNEKRTDIKFIGRIEPKEEREKYKQSNMQDEKEKEKREILIKNIRDKDLSIDTKINLKNIHIDDLCLIIWGERCNELLKSRDTVYSDSDIIEKCTSSINEQGEKNIDTIIEMTAQLKRDIQAILGFDTPEATQNKVFPNNKIYSFMNKDVIEESTKFNNVLCDINPWTPYKQGTEVPGDYNNCKKKDTKENPFFKVGSHNIHGRPRATGLGTRMMSFNTTDTCTEMNFDDLQEIRSTAVGTFSKNLDTDVYCIQEACDKLARNYLIKTMQTGKPDEIYPYRTHRRSHYVWAMAYGTDCVGDDRDNDGKLERIRRLKNHDINKFEKGLLEDSTLVNPSGTDNIICKETGYTEGFHPEFTKKELDYYKNFPVKLYNVKSSKIERGWRFGSPDSGIDQIEYDIDLQAPGDPYDLVDDTVVSKETMLTPSGLIIFSRHPIIKQDSVPFKKLIIVSDSMVAKGAVYAKIDLTCANKGIKYAHVFNVHPSPYVTLSDSKALGLLRLLEWNTPGADARYTHNVAMDYKNIELAHQMQLEEINDFIGKKIREDYSECVANNREDIKDYASKNTIIITGDFNINRYGIYESPVDVYKIQNDLEGKYNNETFENLKETVEKIRKLHYFYKLHKGITEINKDDKGWLKIVNNICDGDKCNHPTDKKDMYREFIQNTLFSDENYGKGEINIIDKMNQCYFNGDNFKEHMGILYFLKVDMELHNGINLKSQSVKNFTGYIFPKLHRDEGDFILSTDIDDSTNITLYPKLEDIKKINIAKEHTIGREADDSLTQLYFMYLLYDFGIPEKENTDLILNLSVISKKGTFLEEKAHEILGDLKKNLDSSKGYIMYTFSVIRYISKVVREYSTHSSNVPDNIDSFIMTKVHELLNDIWLKCSTTPKKCFTTIERSPAIIARYGNQVDTSGRYSETNVDEQLPKDFFSNQIDVLVDNCLKEDCNWGRLKQIVEKTTNKYLIRRPGTNNDYEFSDKVSNHNQRLDEISNKFTKFRYDITKKIEEESNNERDLDIKKQQDVLKEVIEQCEMSLNKNIKKYRNIIELYRCEMSSKNIGQEMQRTCLSLQAFLPKTIINPVYWRNFNRFRFGGNEPRLEAISYKEDTLSVDLFPGDEVEDHREKFKQGLIKDMQEYNSKETYYDVFTKKNSIQANKLDDTVASYDLTPFNKNSKIPDINNIFNTKGYDYKVGIEPFIPVGKDNDTRLQTVPGYFGRFTWDGPKKVDNRRFLGNSLVAGPFWPVDIYEMIDHMLYKTIVYGDEYNKHEEPIHLAEPKWSDTSLIKPVFIQSKGLFVINKKTSREGDDECEPGNSDLAPIWHDVSDHYPIIGNFLFTNPTPTHPDPYKDYHANITSFHEGNDYLSIENTEIKPQDLKLKKIQKHILVKESAAIIHASADGTLDYYKDTSSNKDSRSFYDMFNFHFWEVLARNSVLLRYVLDTGTMNTLERYVNAGGWEYNPLPEPSLKNAKNWPCENIDRHPYKLFADQTLEYKQAQLPERGLVAIQDREIWKNAENLQWNWDTGISTWSSKYNNLLDLAENIYGSKETEGALRIAGICTVDRRRRNRDGPRSTLGLRMEKSFKNVAAFIGWIKSKQIAIVSHETGKTRYTKQKKGGGNRSNESLLGVYSKIVDPNTGRTVDIKSNQGLQIIKNYLNRFTSK